MNKKNTKKFRKRLGDNEKILNPFNAVFLFEDKSYFNENGKKIKNNILIGDHQNPILFDTHNLNKNTVMLVEGKTTIKDRKVEKELKLRITERKVFKNRYFKTKVLHLYVKILDELFLGMEDINE